MNKLKCALAFIFGAAAGVAVSWKLLEQKFDQIAQEKIESVKELYSKKYKEETAEEAEEAVEEINDENEEYSTILKVTGYNASPVVKENKKVKGPYVIAPEEFGETDYETESLTYYADGVLTYDGTDDIVEDVDGMIGKESLTTFGEYEDDSVFVRNDELEKDFEILLDQRNYHDVSGGSKMESED